MSPDTDDVLTAVMFAATFLGLLCAGPIVGWILEVLA